MKYIDEEGKEIDVIPLTEVESRDNKIQELEKALEEQKRVSEEKTGNFKQFNEKTVKLEDELNSLRTVLSEKEAREKSSFKEIGFERFAKGNEDIKKVLQEKYDLLSMPDSTQQDIEARIKSAAMLAGINTVVVNPLNVNPNGDAPNNSQHSDDFLKSEKGQAALKAMGIE